MRQRGTRSHGMSLFIAVQRKAKAKDKGYIVVGGQKAFSMVEGLCMVIDANIVPIGVWLPCSAPQAHFIQIDLPVQSYDHMQLLPMDTPILLPIQN